MSQDPQWQPEFPEARAEVVSALQALSDPTHQQANWGVYLEGQKTYDDLDMNIHILYDDHDVLTDPEGLISLILHPSEVPAMRALDSVFGPMIDDLGDVPDSVYTSDPRWPEVIRAAGEALKVMQATDNGT